LRHDINISFLNRKRIKKLLTNPNSTGKNVEIVRPDVVTRVQTLVPPLMCEFSITIVISSINRK